MVVHNNPDIPGFVHVKRKPHPNGNEYHTITDAESGTSNASMNGCLDLTVACSCFVGVIFGIELVEGRHRPDHLPPRIL